MTVPKLTPADINGAWAIIPTPAKPDASRWDATDTVDLDEAARIVEGMIAAGINGILSLGTLGECATLDWEEKKAFMGVLAETARGRIPVFGGTTALSTRQCVRETRAAIDIGMAGVMVGPSMWNKPDTRMAVQFYKDLAEAVPDAAVCVYANPLVFKFDFPTAFWAEAAAIPQVVCAKVSGYASLLRDLSVTRGGVRFMPIDSEYYGAARLAPHEVTAFWSSGASCGPAPAVALRDAIISAKASGDWSLPARIAGEIGSANLPIIAYGDLNLFQTHNTALERGRMEAAGWMKVGPNRAPYHCIPDNIREWARTGGEMWSHLQSKYSSDQPAVEAVAG